MQVHDRLYRALATGITRYRRTAADLLRTLNRLGIRLPATEAKVRHACDHPFSITRALLETLPQAEILRLVEEMEPEFGLGESAMNGAKPLTWEMALKIQSTGMTIASHTRTHTFLTNESPERVIQEVSGSREELGKRLGTTIKHFAYPDGRFDDVAVSAVNQAGYRFAYTTCLHRKADHPLLTIPRKVLWENSCVDAHGRFSPAIMSCQANRTFDFISGACEVNHSRRPANEQHSSDHSYELTVP
jgi:peptidoglycan/xylan/chitin deacetylase (PgdA/CDA1 family)